MGGYPSVHAQGKRTSESVSIGTGISVYLDNQSSGISINRPNSSNNARSQSESSISRKVPYKAPEGRSLPLKTLDEELARHEEDFKMDVFAIEPENLYKQTKIIHEPGLKNSNSLVITLDTSNSTTSFKKRTPMVQKEESISPSNSIHSSSRGRNVIIEEHPFSSPNSNTITVSSPKNQPTNQEPQGLHIGIPLNYSTSVRIGKKKTKSSDIDAILNPNQEPQMKKSDQFYIPQHKNQRYENVKTSSKVSNDLKKNNSDPHSKMANDVDNYINLMLSKDAEEPENNINDLKHVTHPNPANLAPVTYHGAGRRRKSTTAEDVDDIERQLEALKRSRSTITNKRKNVQPVNNPMIVVVGGDHTLTKDKSLYNVGGVILEKKKVELANRKTRNRKPFSMNQYEDESVYDNEGDEFNFELETECATIYTESEFEEN